VFSREIQELPSVWSTGVDEGTARRGLQEVLEEWMLLGPTRGDPLPVIDGIDLRIELVG